MRKIVFILLLLPMWLTAQVVTTNPAFVTEQAGTIEVIFDATLGSAGMKGATDCYAHAGLITNKSTGDTDWMYAPEWLDNSAKYKMTAAGTNKWKLTISPTIREFYGVTDPTEKVKKLAFVFRTSTGDKEGKGDNNTDIFVNVYEPGLNISFTAPTDNSIVSANAPVSIKVSTSQPATIKLYVNSTANAPVKTVDNASELSHTQSFTTGNYYLISEAVKGSDVVRDTAYICAKGEPIAQNRPAGLKNGITYNADGSVTFCLFAPKKEFVYLLADFNDFRPDNAYMMKRELVGTALRKEYYHWITVSGLDPNKEYAFQYYVEGKIRVGDPYCEKILDPSNDKWINQKYEIYPNLRQYPSGKATDILSVFQINKPKYNWQVTDFKAPASDNLVIYELLIRDFTEEGSIKAVTAKLDYLKGLGINAIELMPIMEFDGNNSWGYNPNYYFAPDKAYGTEEAYKQFIDECHKRGIAVILDVVLNHSWGLSPMCKMWWDVTNNRPATDNPYYNIEAPHPYSVGNDFNHSKAFVTDFFKEVLTYWIKEYKIDGYRFDLSKGLTQTQSNESTAGNKDDSRINIISGYNDAIKAANPNAYTILEHFCNGDEEQALANKGMFCWRKMIDPYQETLMGWGGSKSDITGAYTGQWVSYMESHDEERTCVKAMLYGDTGIKTDLTTRMKQAGDCAAFFVTIPGPKMLWQFQELGYDISIDEGGRTDPKPVLWEYYDNAARKGLYTTYSKLGALRNAYPALFNMKTSYSAKISGNDWDNGRFITLSSGNQKIVIAGNFTSNNKSLSVPLTSGTWYDYMADDKQGTSASGAMSVSIPANSFKLYTNFIADVAGLEQTATENVNIGVYPNPASSTLHVSTLDQINSIELYTLSGLLVKQVNGQSSIAVDDLNDGCYMARILTNGNAHTVKFIKQ